MHFKFPVCMRVSWHGSRQVTVTHQPCYNHFPGPHRKSKFCVSSIYMRHQPWQNKRKHFHSREVLDLLGTPLVHLVLELQGPPGLPERETGNGRKRQRQRGKMSSTISQSLCQVELPKQMMLWKKRGDLQPVQKSLVDLVVQYFLEDPVGAITTQYMKLALS